MKRQYSEENKNLVDQIDHYVSTSNILHNKPVLYRRHFLSFLGLSPLLLASGSAFSKPTSEPTLDFRLIRACRSGDLASVKKLVNEGADVSKIYFNDLYLESPSDNQGSILPYVTPLLVAADNDHLDIVKFLLSKEGDPNITCIHHHGFEVVPIHRCKSLAVLKTLVDAGANVNLASNNYPILMIYSDKFDFMEYLIDHGANIHAKVFGSSILHTIMRWASRYPIEKKIITIFLKSGYCHKSALKDIGDIFKDLDMNVKSHCITTHEYGRHVGFLDSYKNIILEYQAGLVKLRPPKRMVFEQENGRWKIYLKKSTST